MLAKIARIAAIETLWLLASLLLAILLSMVLYYVVRESEPTYYHLLNDLTNNLLIKRVLFGLCLVGLYISRIVWLALHVLFEPQPA